MAMDALDAGKDVYVQKPMAYRIEEAKTMAERVKKSGRVLQVGSQYASETQYFRAREARAQGLSASRSGRRARIAATPFTASGITPSTPKAPQRTSIGSASSAPRRSAPFNQDRFFRWRKYWDYSGGIATDLLYHRLVPFLVALGPQFPVRVSANGGIYVHKDREVPDTISTTIEYPDFQVIMSSSMAADLPGAHLAADHLRP